MKLLFGRHLFTYLFYLIDFGTSNRLYVSSRIKWESEHEWRTGIEENLSYFEAQFQDLAGQTG